MSRNVLAGMLARAPRSAASDFRDRQGALRQKRKALSEWATHLKTVIAQATGANVTALKQRR